MEDEVVIIVDASGVHRMPPKEGAVNSDKETAGSSKMSKVELCRCFVEGNDIGSADEVMVQKIIRKKYALNLYPFLFGAYYFAYRKCYVDVIYSSILGPISGFFFYYSYRNKARKTVKQAYDAGADEAAVTELRKKGGVNPLGPLFVFLIYTFALPLLYYLLIVIVLYFSRM